MIMPRPFELYSYYETGEVFVVSDVGYCNTLGYMVTLIEVNSEIAEKIVVPISMFNEELSGSRNLRYAYSRVELAPINQKPRQVLNSIPTCELVAELNTRSAEYYGIDRSSIIDHYYDLGITLPNFEDNSINFIKCKEAQTKDQMLKTLQVMNIEAGNRRGRPVSVRHHIVLDVINPEMERPV